jgi:two-component system, repressor protein LuxO
MTTLPARNDRSTAAAPGPRALLVEDTESLAQVYTAYLVKQGIPVTHVATGAAAMAALDGQRPEVVLLDVQLPDMNGLDILRHIRERNLPSEVVVITAHGSIGKAVEAMREGAFDFLVKPFSADRLTAAVRGALARHQVEAAEPGPAETPDGDRYFGFVGRSDAMHEVYRKIENVASSKASVFITGESGTGKELTAEAIHRRSARRSGPFVTVNCAAIPKDLLESELFGHAKGAFTGATAERDGAALQADGGTLFLDELGEMPLELQAKVLRFLQNGTVQRIGDARPRPVDVRIVCATNRDPVAEVKAGRLREDLFYRLYVIPLDLPPLRARGEDVLLIARSFLAQFAREENKGFRALAPETERLLAGYSWPGNVRQLQNVIRHAVVLHDGDVVQPLALPPLLDDTTPAPSVAPAGPATGEPVTKVRPLWLVEKEAIEAAIRSCDGNVPRAAALLEVSPSTVYRKLQEWQKSGR